MSKSSDLDRLRAVLIYQTAAPADLPAALRDAANNKIAALFPGLPLFSNRAVGDARLLTGDQNDCLLQCFDAVARHEQDSVALFCDFFAHLDPDLTQEVRELHFKYLAQYSFAENAPAGFAPDFVSAEIRPHLEAKRPADLRAFVVANINDIDVEMVYRLPDLRQYRMDLSSATPRSRRLAADILTLEPKLRYSDLEGLLQKHPRLLRPFPSYFEVELTNRRMGQPQYAPQSASARTEADLGLGLLEKLVTEIAASGLPGDGSVCLGGHGEPLLHPQFLECARMLLAEPAIGQVFLETYGLQLDAALFKALMELPGSDRLRLILKLPSLKSDRYRRLAGFDGLATVIKNIEAAEQVPTGERPAMLFVEMLKITDVEDEIPDFFDRFESKGVFTPLLNKFNSYAGRLPERRVSDLTPLVRDYCRHLARDLYLTAEGRVPLCKQDPFAEGSVTFDFAAGTVDSIFEQTAAYHGASMRGNHADIPAPCLACDEWFTFNA